MASSRSAAAARRALGACAALLLAACTQHSVVGVVRVGGEADPADEDGGADAGARADADAAATTLVVVDACSGTNAAGIDPPTLAALRGARDASGLRFLYPYDLTVFPRGLGAPLLQWEGPAASAAYVRLSASAFRYEGCLPITQAGELLLDPGVWRAAETASQGPDDVLTLVVALATDGAVRGPMTTRLAFATSRARGSVYYQTYDSQRDALTAFASIMRVPLGGVAEVSLGQASCNGCHSLAASGVGILATLDGAGRAFTLARGTLGAQIDTGTGLPGAEFAALDPSARYYVANAHPVSASAPMLPSFGGQRLTSSGLYALADGRLVADGGVPTGAMMPSFARSGTALAFNDFDDGAGHSLSVADFAMDVPQLGPARRVFFDALAYPGWPQIVGDGPYVVFALGKAASFGADGAGLLGSTGAGQPSDLALVNSLTGQSAVLWRAVGYASSADADAAQPYLPFGLEEVSRNYYPTVMATDAGSHAFVCFDSLRHYGGRPLRRAIWCAAIASDVGDAEDPSAPAFYLPGQEDTSANFRPVAAEDGP